MKEQMVYHITKGYNSVTMWLGKESGERRSIRKVTPAKSLSRYDKYLEIVWAIKSSGGTPPSYHPIESEK
jgi:hypothetical protein